MIRRNDLRKQISQYKNQTAFAKDIHYLKNSDHSVIFGHDKNILYYPTGTAKLFHQDNSFVRLVMGPYGSGKSTMCAHEIIKRACEMPYWKNGRRNSKVAIVRNTSGELQSTTLQTILQWFGNLGDIKKRQKPILNYEFQFNDGNGIVELELIFIALDREEDIRKIKSLEVSMVYINELSEVPQNALAHFKGRCNGRYPGAAACSEPYFSGIICDTNPPSEDHWIYKDFEEKNLESYKIFHQPPGLLKDDDNKWVRNPDADNAINLAPDYYTKLAEGQSEDFVKVYCLGRYGIVGNDKRVFPEYNPDRHAVDDLKAIQGAPLYLGYDFGLTPTCLVSQISPRGQLIILKEYCSEDMGLRTFTQSIVIPGLSRDFPYCKEWICYADPSGGARDQIIDELSCLGELQSLGIDASPARTNDLDPRLSSVRYFLNKMVDGNPAFILSKKGCPNLHKGLARDYVYKRMAVSGEVRYKDKPDKNSSSHVADCLQYICLELASDSIAERQTKKQEVDMWNPTFRGL